MLRKINRQDAKNARRSLCVLGALAVQVFIFSAHADEATVAVAANFLKTAQHLADEFKKSTGDQIILSAGSSGKICAQIKSGAPFDLFLSADAQRPKQLEEEGLAVKGTRFTYAVGRLALWSPKAGFVDDKGDVLRQGNFQHLALGNPAIAPYGLAAKQAMEKMGLWDKFKDRVVQGEDIAQTFQFVKTGNAELGFVALAQIKSEGKTTEGSAWIVPEKYYDPLEQQAVLLIHGKENRAAREFLVFLKSVSARAMIEKEGYRFPK